MLDGKDKFLVDSHSKPETKKRVSWLLNGIFVIIFVIISTIFYSEIKPIFQSKEQQVFEREYKKAESFYDEAKALSLSMPLLSDSIVFVVADSLLATLVGLNHDWMIFVSKDRGYENYILRVETLNNKIDKVRLEYEIVKAFRGMKNMLKEEEIRKRRWIESKKKKTFVQIL